MILRDAFFCLCSPTRCSTGGGATSRLASTAAGDNCSRSAQMPQEQGSRRTTAEDCLQLQPRRSHSPKPSYGQQDLQVQPAPAAHTVQRSAAAAPQEQHLLAQHVKQRSPPWPTQQPPNGQRSSENSCVPESISGVLVSDQSQPAHVSNVTLDSTIQDSRQHDLADCSVPASIPGQEWMGQQANNSLQGRPGSLLEQPPGTQMPSGSIGSAAEVASGSLGVDMRQGSSGDCSYTGSPELGSGTTLCMVNHVQSHHGQTCMVADHVAASPLPYTARPALSSRAPQIPFWETSLFVAYVQLMCCWLCCPSFRRCCWRDAARPPQV